MNELIELIIGFVLGFIISGVLLWTHFYFQFQKYKLSLDKTNDELRDEVVAYKFKYGRAYKINKETKEGMNIERNGGWR